jgi:RNase P/RNase MRP subunit p29
MSFLNSLLDGIVTKELGKKFPVGKQGAPSSGEARFESPNPATRIQEEKDHTKPANKSTHRIDEEEAILVNKRYLRMGNIFDHAYDAIKADVKPNSGLKTLVAICHDKEKAENKLRGKCFLLRKNEVLRGKKQRNTKRGTVSRKVIKQNHLFEVKSLTFEHAKVLNKLWEEYIKKVIPLSEEKRPAPSQNKGLGQLRLPMNSSADQSKYLPMVRADLHGAWVRVLASRNRVDEEIEGIVVKETIKTLRVCCPDDKQKVLLKENIILGVKVLPDHWFQILGLNMILRADDRSKYKPKWKNPVPKLQKILPLTKSLFPPST